MLDVDRFKEINDSTGHLWGDKVLQTIAYNLQNILRDTDRIGRYGGEEFIVIAEVDSHSEASALGERLREQVENLTVQTPKGKIRPTISLGIALMDEYKHTSDVLIDHADAALYISKNEGRNMVTIADLILK